MSTILTIQPSTIDNCIKEGAPNQNFGNQESLLMYVATGSRQRGLFRFDFSSLPTGAIISAATFNLYYFYHAVNDPKNRTYRAYELTQILYTEMGSTWNKYDGTNAWTAAGGDYTTTNGASVTIPTSYGWLSFNVLALVQHFQSDHAEIANFLVRDGTEDNSAMMVGVYSRDEPTQLTLRPKLIITYTMPAIVLTAEAGSYGETGQAAALRAARKMAAAAASYSLTGQATVLKAARKIAAGAGSFTLTGQLAALRAARRIAAAPNSYALTGQAVDLKPVRRIVAAAGSYALTGQDAVLRAMRLLAAAGGSYALTGMDANLFLGHHYTLVAEAGSYGEPYSKIFVTVDGRIYKKMGNTYLRIG